MAFLGPLIAGALLNIAASLVGRVLLALGIGVVTYSGFQFGLGFLRDLALTHFRALPPDVLGMLSLMKVGVCLSMYLSALTARLALNGMTSDTIKRFVKA